MGKNERKIEMGAVTGHWGHLLSCGRKSEYCFLTDSMQARNECNVDTGINRCFSNEKLKS